MGLKDLFGKTQSKSLGGHNTPKAGERGFQKSQIIKGKAPTVGISKHSITSNPILTLVDFDYINKRISDAKVIDLKLVMESMKETELGEKWNKYPKGKSKTQQDIQETLDYLVLMNGRFSTFLNTAPELRILITPSISKKVYKQAILIDLAKKNRLESILNDDQYSALTKCFAKISLDIWAEGQTLAKEIEEYHKDNKELWSGEDIGFFGVSEKRFEHQAREPESSFRNFHLHLPLKEAGVIYAKRVKEIDELLEESKKTALTSAR